MKKRTIEEYVEIVLIIENEKKRVQTNDVASALDVNPASVTEMFQKLSNEGYINYERYSGVTLTEKGRKIAIITKKRHETLKDFLMILGVDEKIADDDACRIEHNVDPQTMKKLRIFVEYAKMENVCSRWLDHFKYFDETGKYIECKPANEEKCPVHGKK